MFATHSLLFSASLVLSHQTLMRWWMRQTSASAIEFLVVDAHTSASVGVTSPEATGDESYFLWQLLKVHVRPYNVNSVIYMYLHLLCWERQLDDYIDVIDVNDNVMLTSKVLHKGYMDINVYFMQDF